MVKNDTYNNSKRLKHNLLKIILFITIFALTKICYCNIYGSTSSSLDLNCNSAIAMDFDSGSILYGKDMNKKIYPASTTKILTAILTIENLDLDKKVIVSSTSVDSTPDGSSVMGVKQGEIFTIEELLYGLMLPSGNDAALVLAEAVSGNVESFVNLMNEKLQEIGCYNTHFANPHGFHDENHYTTAHDMVKLFRYCLKNDTFKKIIGTYEYELASTNITNTTRKLINTNKLLNVKNSNTYYQFAKGGKTGYTDEARNTLISYSVKDGKTIIVGTFGGILDSNRVPYTYSDSKILYEYCFNNFYLDTIAKSSDYIFKVKDNIASKIYNVQLEEDIFALTNKTDILYTTYTINIDYDKIDKIIKNKTDNKRIGKIEINYISNGKKYSNTYNLKYISFENFYTINSIITENIVIILVPLIIILCSLMIIHIIIKFKLK